MSESSLKILYRGRKDHLPSHFIIPQKGEIVNSFVKKLWCGKSAPSRGRGKQRGWGIPMRLHYYQRMTIGIPHLSHTERDSSSPRRSFFGLRMRGFSHPLRGFGMTDSPAFGYVKTRRSKRDKKYEAFRRECTFSYTTKKNVAQRSIAPLIRVQLDETVTYSPLSAD